MSTNAGPHPNTVIARIIEELNANPELKPLLLRVMLTEEFLLLPAKVDRLAELYSELAGTVNGLVSTVNKLADTVSELAAKVNILEVRVNRVEGQLGNLLGEKYERRIARSIRSKAHSELGIRRAQVLQGETTTDYESLLDAILEAKSAGVVTPEETDSLERADYVLYGTDLTNGLPRAAVVEVSITIDRHDVDRAAERAGTLGRVMDCPSAAAVVGNDISEFDRRRAEAVGVKVLIIAE